MDHCMLDYTGIKCPVCGKPFRSGDDIVVCPECGAPYHRACYQEKGSCIFEDLHKEGKDWKPPEEPKPADPRAEIKDQECPVCGTLNAHSALYCNRCGAPLKGEASYGGQQAPPPPTWNSAPQQRTGFGGAVPPFAFDPMGGVSPAEELDPGVTFGDASKLVKQNTGYYMPVFRYIKNTRHNKFNFTAFLFSGAWMLYRKQYKYGAIITVLMFLLYLGYLCANFFVATPLMLDLMEQVGADISQTLNLTNDQLLAITQIMMDQPLLYLQLSLPMLCLAVMLGVMIFVGVRGNKMYMRHCIRTAHRARASEGDYSAALDAKGGVNVAIAICLLVCYLIVANIPLWL